MNLTKKQITSFRRFIWAFYAEQGRSFAWRNVDNPYHVVVSEIMLQQTQTYRVAPKYEQFIAAFPDFSFLASASLRNVLSAWQGLGYNRRGKYLQQIAQKVMSEHNGALPQFPDILETFPGIGKATAASICAFAYNIPTVFIETNIRAVFIHSFFPYKDTVHDREIMPLIEQTLDHNNPREWYYALMDYGVMLKKKFGNPSRRSKHHTQQSTFKGSDRQIRGAIVRQLTKTETLHVDDLFARLELEEKLPVDIKRTQKILDQLIEEKMVLKKGAMVCI